MAVYRQIQITFWQDPFVLELTPEEKYFYIYLMTNSKTSQCGIYELSKRIIEIETGYTRDKINELIEKFIKYKKILYCEDTSEIMLLNWIKYNGSNSPKVKSRIEKELKDIKKVEFVKVYLDLLKTYGYSISPVFIQYINSIDTKSQKKEEKEKEKEKKEEKEKEASPPPKNSFDLCKYYETLKPGQSITGYLDTLNIWIDMYSYEWTKEAIQKCIGSKGKFIKPWIEAVLKSWLNEGKEEADGGTRQNTEKGKNEFSGFRPKEPKIEGNIDETDLI